MSIDLSRLRIGHKLALRNGKHVKVTEVKQISHEDFPPGIFLKILGCDLTMYYDEDGTWWGDDPQLDVVEILI